MAWFSRQKPGVEESSSEGEKRVRTEGLWLKCESCGQVICKKALEENNEVCPQCEHHFPLSSARRIELVLDPGSFVEADGSIESVDPLIFRDSKKYSDRLRSARRTAGGADSLRSGSGRIEEIPVELCVFVFEFMGGSMGSVAGEKITRVFERALERKVPALIFSASGGARMQEGVLSLMQMAKTSAALGRLREAGLPYLSILLHPTTGGVAASFAMLGDVIIAEPRALIGFAGQRVIANTIKTELPEGFQRAEFLLDHGFIDMIVARHDLRSELARLIDYLAPRA